MKLAYPITTEKAMGFIESKNTVCFVVDKKATKPQIRDEVEKTYSEKVLKVNTLNTSKGLKKAFVTFKKPGAAADVAAKLKVV